MAAVDRLDGMNEPHTIVIGGGLAGLTAAATLARAGRPVTVLEAGEHLGGRARTRRRDGFDLNLGPHALYRVAGGRRVLRRLGVRVSGRIPRIHRAAFLADDRVVPGVGYLRQAIDDRGRVARALIGLGAGDAGEWAGRTAEEWIDSAVVTPDGRAVVQSALRTATYTADHSLLDAGAAGHQLRVASHGVLYLHGGWASLVEGLADAIRSAGGQIRTGAAVEAVEHDTRVRAVRLADGTTLGADAAVVAVNDPHRIPALLDGPGAATVEQATAGTVAVRMAHLDVALRPLPQPRFANVLGIDEPIYLSVQSDVAHVAPPGGASINVGRYLRPGEEDGDHRASIEHFLDVVQPGWQDHVIDARYVPRSMVCGDHARAATRGTLDRPGVDVAGIGGLALAGDWVGPAGTLADAAIMSGQAAASTIMDAAMSPSPFTAFPGHAGRGRPLPRWRSVARTDAAGRAMSERVFERANDQARSSAQWCTAAVSDPSHEAMVHQTVEGASVPAASVAVSSSPHAARSNAAVARTVVNLTVRRGDRFMLSFPPGFTGGCSTRGSSSARSSDDRTHVATGTSRRGDRQGASPVSVAGHVRFDHYICIIWACQRLTITAIWGPLRQLPIDRS